MAGEARLRQVRAADLTADFRAADRREAWAATGLPFAEALARSLALSTRAWTGTIDGRTAAIFGVAAASPLTGLGVPWLVGTDLVGRHPRVFLRRSRPILGEMLRLYPRLVNYVDADNEAAVRWLGWLGFRIAAPEPFGPFALPFHRFSLEA